MDISELFTMDSKCYKYRGHTIKSEKLGCIRNSRKLFFSHSVVGRWNSLDQEMVDALSVNDFKRRL